MWIWGVVSKRSLHCNQLHSYQRLWRLDINNQECNLKSAQLFTPIRKLKCVCESNTQKLVTHKHTSWHRQQQPVLPLPLLIDSVYWILALINGAALVNMSAAGLFMWSLSGEGFSLWSLFTSAQISPVSFACLRVCILVLLRSFFLANYWF